MNINQEVIVRVAYREGHKVGGWLWREYPATILFLWRKTALVRYVNYQAKLIERRVPISHLREIQTHVKTSVKVQSLELSIIEK